MRMSGKRKSQKRTTVEVERGGKDEMNLAEFPLHFMTNKTTDQEVKTLADLFAAERGQQWLGRR